MSWELVRVHERGRYRVEQQRYMPEDFDQPSWDYIVVYERTERPSEAANAWARIFQVRVSREYVDDARREHSVTDLLHLLTAAQSDLDADREAYAQRRHARHQGLSQHARDEQEPDTPS